MARVRQRAPRVILALAVIVAALAPLASGQLPSQNHCPAGDQGDQSPDGVDPAKPHFDLSVGEVRLTFGGTSATERGAYLVSRASGSGDVSIDVENIGTADPGGTSTLRLVLTRPDGTTSTQEPTFNVPGPGKSVTVTTGYTFDAGRHTLKIDVNPDQSPAESCTDATANANCGGATTPCTTTYYENNGRVIGLQTGGLPVLRVESLSAANPLRATHTPSSDSEARIDVRLQNTGGSPAFNLDEVAVGAAPFHVRVEVVGCSCEPALRSVTSIAAGSTRTVSATFPLHGLANEYEVKVTIDPGAKTADLDRKHVIMEDRFHLPTPDIVLSARDVHGDPVAGPLHVIGGEDLVLYAVIGNAGDAAARNVSGGPFRVTVHRDNLDHLVHEAFVALPAKGETILTVVDRAANVTGNHVYRIRADPEDDVLEATNTPNILDVKVLVASYDAMLQVAPENRRMTVPPGVDAKIPFTIENSGNAPDTYHLSIPAADAARQHYEDVAGERVQEALVPGGEAFHGWLVRTIPRDAAQGDESKTEIRVRSNATNSVSTENVTFVVGPDDAPPTIDLADPESGYLSTDRIVLRVADNVGLARVESDVSGSFQEIRSDTDGGALYTLDAAGTPSEFTLNVRATDVNGNEAERSFEIVRDLTAPRIVKTSFTPDRGVKPGQSVSLLIEARDPNMERVDVQITQPRPGGIFSQNFTLRGAGPHYNVKDWTVPERPGHYIFNITAYDKAGNKASEVTTLSIAGLNIRIVSNQPTVRPPEPAEGERVTMGYVIENTSPSHATGPFFVTLVVDFQRQIGLERVDLGPAERRNIEFIWTATPGQHAFTFVVDQAEEVAEDCEGETCNLLFTTTDILFPDQPLFAPEMVRAAGFLTFPERVQRHWYIPVLFLATLALFAVAARLARRQGDA